MEFMPDQSVLVQKKIVHLPLVDIWTKQLKQEIIIRFGDLDFKRHRYSFNPIIKVTNTYAFAHKGLLRSIGGALLDLGNLKFSAAIEKIYMLVTPLAKIHLIIMIG